MPWSFSCLVADWTLWNRFMGTCTTYLWHEEFTSTYQLWWFLSFYVNSMNLSYWKSSAMRAALGRSSWLSHSVNTAEFVGSIPIPSILSSVTYKSALPGQVGTEVCLFCQIKEDLLCLPWNQNWWCFNYDLCGRLCCLVLTISVFREHLRNSLYTMYLMRAALYCLNVH